MSPVDPYDRLRPSTDIEECECEVVTHLLLIIGWMSENPISCGECRREVDPERLRLTTKEVDLVAGWNVVSNSLYWLWLDSGEYEEYAKARLSDPTSQINTDGMKVAEMLSARLPTRLWYYSDTDDGTLIECPVCARPLDTNVKWGTGDCPVCKIRM
ncbi:MAG: hypothetical protein DRR42_07165 [Gammaproteobacteria bacterium]|nr:MAG: hypothetical protein DRR42_07165 [Gammaproteobacteria bacterium]